MSTKPTRWRVTCHPSCCFIPAAIVGWVVLVVTYTAVTNFLGV